MNILEAAQEYLDNVNNGAKYFYSENYVDFRYKFDENNSLVEEAYGSGIWSDDISMVANDFLIANWLVHYFEPELKPCPFCGNKKVSLHGNRASWVACGQCGCSQISYNERKEAITAWNRRGGDK